MKNFLKKIGLNRQISQQKLSIDFKKPFNFLANPEGKQASYGAGLPADLSAEALAKEEVRGDLSAVARSAKEEAPSEAANSIWCIYTIPLEPILSKIPEKNQPDRPKTPDGVLNNERKIN